MGFYCDHPYVKNNVEDADCKECEHRNQPGCKYYNQPRLSQPSSSRGLSEINIDKILTKLCGDDSETKEFVQRACSRFEDIKIHEGYRKKKYRTKQNTIHKKLVRVRDPKRIFKQVYKENLPIIKRLWELKDHKDCLPDSNGIARGILSAAIKEQTENLPLPRGNLYYLRKYQQKQEKQELEYRKNMMREVYRRCKKQNPDATDNFIFDQIAFLLNRLHNKKYTRQNIYYLVKSR